MRRVTQRERVLKQLKKSWKRGVHSFWGYQNYIPRMGAIIFDLKRDGYDITSIRNKKDNGCTYYLNLKRK